MTKEEENEKLKMENKSLKYKNKKLESIIVKIVNDANQITNSISL